MRCSVPDGAISVGRGTATNRVVVPELNANFETNVPGLYIVGELGGRALIKNAVSEGRVAAEHVVKVVARRRGDGDGVAGVVDVAIIGSGPAGLSAGLVAHRAGIDYLLLEQGTLAETVRKYPRHKVLFAEPLTMPLYGDLWVSDASKESLLAIWEGVIARTGLRVQTGQHVREIVRERGWFVITTADATHRARAVVLALGRRGTPRRLDVPGEELSTVFYDVAEMSDFAGRRVLVIGGGDSAIESALGLANQAGTIVTLSYRGDAFARLKDRNRTRIDAAIAAGRVVALMRSEVREIQADVAVVNVAGTTQIVPCDDVVVRIGGESPTVLLEQLGVRMVTKELARRFHRDTSGRAMRHERQASKGGVVRLTRGVRRLCGALFACQTLAAGIPLLLSTAGAQISPGPLAAAHASLDGPLNCTKCHAGGKASMTSRCVSCHREIAWLAERNRGLHARAGRADCATCHPDHAGRDFALVKWPDGSANRFDHARAGWSLEGKHARLSCEKCHTADRRVSPPRRSGRNARRPVGSGSRRPARRVTRMSTRDHSVARAKAATRPGVGRRRRSSTMRDRSISSRASTLMSHARNVIRLPPVVQRRPHRPSQCSSRCHTPTASPAIAIPTAAVCAAPARAATSRRASQRWKGARSHTIARVIR